MIELLTGVLIGALFGAVLVGALALARARASRELQRVHQRQIRDMVLRSQEQELALERSFEERQSAAEAAQEQQRRQHEVELDATERELEARERDVDARGDALAAGESRLAEQQRRLDGEAVRVAQELERTAGLTRDEARRELVESIVEDARQQAGAEIRALRDTAQEEAHAHAAVVVATAAHRMAAEFVSSHTVTVVPLASDDMKGRIIGREGRNIRALEYATGVDVIVDDTPELVVLSGFSPLRREVAKRALLRLLDDGRIHPARIEEVVNAVREDLDTSLAEEGETLAEELGVGELSAELNRMLGRLRLHGHGGLNVLDFARQTVFLAGTMSDELSVDSGLARRCGLFLALGLIADHQLGGHHREAALELARQHREPARVLRVLAPLARYEPDSVVAALVDTASRLALGRRAAAGASAARDDQSIYIKRHQEMEALARSFGGVEEAHVVQAGREMRVMVNFAKVDDDAAVVLAEEIAAEVRASSRFPGEVRVMVVREARAIEVAR